MEALLVLSYVMTGGILGAGLDWLFWRSKFRQAGDQANARGESLHKQFQEQLSAQAAQLAQREAELAAKEDKLGSLAGALEDVRRQCRDMEQRLQENGRKLSLVEAVNARIPELEAALDRKEADLQSLRQEASALAARNGGLEKELEEERRSLQDCLIFVEGTHYLPGKVVRHLTGSDAS